MIAICEFCGKEYKTFKNWYNRVEHHTCSKSCAFNLKKKLNSKFCKNCGSEYNSGNHQKDSIFCSIKCSKEYKLNNKKTYNKTCKCCGKNFIVFQEQINKSYCSENCRSISRFNNSNGKYCLECGKPFINSKSIKFCSYSCFRDFSNKNSNKQVLECVNCGTSFVRNPGEIKKAKNHFCSPRCKYEFNRGKNHYEYKEFLHDKSLKLALKQWSHKIKEKDNFICQYCGCSDKKFLEAHHIKSRSEFPELQFDFDNGITLCLDCHSKQHLDDKRSFRLIKYKLDKLLIN